jgi:hypothetical protein
MDNPETLATLGTQDTLLAYSGLQHFLLLYVLYVYKFLVPCCDVSYDFRKNKAMFDSSMSADDKGWSWQFDFGLTLVIVFKLCIPCLVYYLCILTMVLFHRTNIIHMITSISWRINIQSNLYIKTTQTFIICLLCI